MRVDNKHQSVRQTFHVINTPVARKAWICHLCGEPVTIGERYVRYTWRQEKTIDDLPLHPQCFSIIKFYCKTTGNYMFSSEAVHEWLKTRYHCKRCTDPICVLSKCERVGKWVKHKPLLTYYDKLTPMPEEQPKEPEDPSFKILDE